MPHKQLGSGDVQQVNAMTSAACTGVFQRCKGCRNFLAQVSQRTEAAIHNTYLTFVAPLTKSSLWCYRVEHLGQHCKLHARLGQVMSSLMYDHKMMIKIDNLLLYILSTSGLTLLAQALHASHKYKLSC